jgi:hypothetical protein
VVDGTGEHASELRAADDLVDRLHLALGIGEGVFVALLDGELEVLRSVFELLSQRLDGVDLLFDARAPSQDLLGFVLVVPEVGCSGLFVELVQLLGKSRDVKDASLAPHSAFEGLRVFHGFRLTWDVI